MIGGKGAGVVKLPPTYFFLDRQLLLIDLKLDTHTEYLKKSQRKKNLFEHQVTFFTDFIIYQHFLQET